MAESEIVLQIPENVITYSNYNTPPTNWTYLTQKSTCHLCNVLGGNIPICISTHSGESQRNPSRRPLLTQTDIICGWTLALSPRGPWGCFHNTPDKSILLIGLAPRVSRVGTRAARQNQLKPISFAIKNNWRRFCVISEHSLMDPAR